jgi:hypothetical protein
MAIVVKKKKRGPGRPRMGPVGGATLRVQDIPEADRKAFGDFVAERGLTARFVIIRLMQRLPRDPRLAGIILGD